MLEYKVVSFFLMKPNKFIFLFGFFCISLKHNKQINKMIASELKIEDTFKKQGFKFTIKEIKTETYKNGKLSLLVSCTTNEGKIIDSFFHFKPTSKIK